MFEDLGIGDNADENGVVPQVGAWGGSGRNRGKDSRASAYAQFRLRLA